MEGKIDAILHYIGDWIDDNYGNRVEDCIDDLIKMVKWIGEDKVKWISVKDKLPEDMYEIKRFPQKKEEIVKVVLLYKPLIFDYDEECFYISKLDQEMSVVTRLIGTHSDEYSWIDGNYNVIYDQQAIAWLPIPKYEEGGSDDVQ